MSINTLNIKTLNSRNEPFNIDTTNIEEPVYFFYEPDPNQGTSFIDLDLNGSETWIWNFDAGYSSTSGFATDQVVQEFIGFDNPLPIIFYREGERVVSVDVYEDSILKYSDSITFQVYKFPTHIVGPEYASNGSIIEYSITYSNTNYGTLVPTTYKWFINGTESGSNSPILSYIFSSIKAVIQCVITNGTETKTLESVTTLSIGNGVKGKRYETDVVSDLKFFNKEGDYLNFQYIEEDGNKYWDGEQIFHENGSDTFKTIGLYILEKVDPIKFKSDQTLLRKLQMFNEYGIDFDPSYNNGSDILIDKIESVNNRSDFYTKWLYANDIHLKIPLGAELILSDFTEIIVDNSIESNPILLTYNTITDLDSDASTSGLSNGVGYITYTVVGNKKDALMVITDINNQDFNPIYGYGEFRTQNNSIVNIPKGKITTVNLIKPINANNLDPEWNEPQYKNQIYDRKKLSVLGTQNNDGIYTINYINDSEQNKLSSKLYKSNSIDSEILIPDPSLGFGFRTKIEFKTNKIFLSSAPIDFLPSSGNPFLNSKNILVWESTIKKDYTPPILKEGNSFGFDYSQLSSPELNLSYIYKTIKVSDAATLLKPQTKDTDGYRLSFLSNDIEGLVLSFIVNNISTYVFTEGIEWFKGLTIEHSAIILASYINTNITGITCIAVDNEVWIWQKTGYIFNINDRLPNGICEFNQGILSENNPIYGIVADQWVLLNNDEYNGYIHQVGYMYHIVYFDGIYPNQTPIWYPLPTNKKIVWTDPTNNIEFKQNLIADAYLEENSIVFDTPGDLNQGITREMLISRFIQQYSQTLNTYGIDTYLSNNDLVITRNYSVDSMDDRDDYINVTFYREDTNSYIDLTNDTTMSNQIVDMFQVLEPVVSEKNRIIGKNTRTGTISSLYERKIIIKDIDQKFGLSININGVDYNVPYDNIGGGSNENEDTILDIQETLQDWGNQRFSSIQDTDTDSDSDIGRKYHEILERLGIITWLEQSDESWFDNTPHYDTLVLQSKYPNVNIQFNLNGTLNTHKILNTSVKFHEITSVLNITINRIQYSIPYMGSVSATLAEWVETYSETLLEQDIIVDHLNGTVLSTIEYESVSGSGTNTELIIDIETTQTDSLRFSTLFDKTLFDMSIWTGKNQVLGKDLYTITNYRKGNTGILISGNEIIDTTVDFQDVGFATAMITSINNSEFPLNNQEYNILFLDPNIIGLSYQGPFWQNDQGLGYGVIRSGGFDWTDYDEYGYGSSTSGTNGSLSILELVSREFLRYPRERFDGQDPIQFKFSWEEEDDIHKDIFYYDFSGQQLTKKVTEQGIYQYTGPIPLLDSDNTAYLNKSHNRDLSKISDPIAQQTIFESLIFDLYLIDSETEIDPKPKPIQIFTGFKGDYEGVSERNMLIHRKENISLSIETQLKNKNDISLGYKDILEFDQEKSEIVLKDSMINFVEAGFIVGQRIYFTGKDISSDKNQATFKNAGFRGEIVSITVNKIKLRSLDSDRTIKTESSLTVTRTETPPYKEKPALLKIDIVVEDRLIGKIKLRGQTEIEDYRFKTILNNFGKNINHRDVFLFKEYDIKENGIDWVFLNQKRKEMLSVYPEIYNYIGSYKSVVNAINYFGYNDLEFYEYYINVDPEADQYKKLYKVEIPDLFNNRIDGFTPNDFILKTLPNKTYNKTKLFNLTYRITDRTGNFVLAYSLEEVITKLLGLKRWLQEELMPIGTRIMDLTGRGETTGSLTIWNDMKMSRKISLNENLTPIDFKIESYIQPVENGSRTHNINIAFFVNNNSDIPLYYHVKIETFSSYPDQTDPNFALSKVQEINMFKTDLKSINFASDKTIDPFILVSVICDNGYGVTYSRKKSYSL